METLSWSDGMALFLMFALVGYMAWLGLTAGSSRRWIRRMQRMEAGRRRQEAEWLANNCFREWRT